MAELCDICGDVGYADLVFTCSRCRIAHEHIYCMRVFPKNITESCVCESCLLGESNSAITSEEIQLAFYKLLNESEQQLQSEIARHTETGDVKFMPAEEVVKLLSGVVTGSSAPKSKSMASLFQRIFYGSEIIPANDASFGLDIKHSVVSSAHIKSLLIRDVLEN